MSDGPGEEDGPWAAGWLQRVGLDAAPQKVYDLHKAAEAVVAHIGAFGDIDSRNPLSITLLRALESMGPPLSDSPHQTAERQP